MTLYDTVEKLIDKHGVASVLTMMADVMQDKSEHIIVNWQDYGLAAKWVKASRIIVSAVIKLPKVSGVRV